MSNAVSGVGTTLTDIGLGAIAEVRNIRGPGMSRDLIEVTNLDSTGGWKEFIASFRDAGELTFSMNFSLPSFNAIWQRFLGDNAATYWLQLPDPTATTIVFSALVVNVPMSIDPADAVMTDVTLRLTGQVTINT